MSETFESDFKTALPELRGRLKFGAMMSELTWFRVGGPARVLYTPADEDDLAYFMANRPKHLPWIVVGLGSNLLIRDGGFGGIVIRLARPFNQISVEGDRRLRVGCAVPDVKVARAACEAGIGGLSFYRGIPGGIGGALRMNGGAHGTETKDVLKQVRAIDSDGRKHVLAVADLNYRYRHCGASTDLIFTEALFEGEPGDREQIQKDMEEVASYREEHQPTKARTGGSTFKNPDGHSAWKLIDEAGMRGFRVGGAHVSEKHCNFLINDGEASAEDIERLGETVRARVKDNSGVTLEWEIKRFGVPRPGGLTGEALALDPLQSAS